MDDNARVPALAVHRVTFGGLIPLARYYHCVYCEHDLSDWVMKLSPSESSAYPNCEAPIDAWEIAQAQRDTKLGCLWLPVSIVCLLLGCAAVVALVWLITGPNPLIHGW